MMTDIADALRAVEQARRKRDREIVDLYRKGWRLSRLADHFGISRQRAQQIAAKARKA